MLMRRNLQPLLSIVTLSLLASCASTTPSSQVSPGSSVGVTESEVTESQGSQTSSPSADTKQSSSTRPETQTAILMVEGEAEEIELQLFDEQSLPFTTYLPEGNFIDEVGTSPEGTAVRFYWSYDGEKDESAYIQVAFPTENVSSSEMRDSILSEDGLLASNNWQIIEQSSTSAYEWAKEEILYEEDSETGYFIGTVLIGEHNGKSFFVTTHYPAEYAEGFEPRANLVFENLEFRE